MAEPYPYAVSMFEVVGRLMRGIGDTDSDFDKNPDLIPIVGAQIVFSPLLSPPVFKVPNAVPAVTIFQESIMATTDSEGYLTVAGSAQRGVVLPYGFDPDIVPSGWSWAVRISVGGDFPDDVFTIAGTPGQPIDLTTHIRVPAAPIPDISEWVQVTTRVERLLASNEGVRDQVRSLRDQTETALSQARVARDDAIAAVAYAQEAFDSLLVPDPDDEGTFLISNRSLLEL